MLTPLARETGSSQAPCALPQVTGADERAGSAARPPGFLPLLGTCTHRETPYRCLNLTYCSHVGNSNTNITCFTYLTDT